MLDIIKRTARTAVRLPFAAAWDIISLGNMGEGASTTKVLREHKEAKEVDDFLRAVNAAREVKDALRKHFR